MVQQIYDLYLTILKFLNVGGPLLFEFLTVSLHAFDVYSFVPTMHRAIPGIRTFPSSSYALAMFMTKFCIRS